MELAVPERRALGLGKGGTLLLLSLATLEALVGWEWAFAFLVLGPLVGIWAMLRLRRSPGAAKPAGGRG